MNAPLEFRRLRRTLTLGYLASVVVLAGSLALTHRQNRRKLALGFAQASRHSLLSGDLRQAYGSLQPALEDGFQAIAVLDARGAHVLDIPTPDIVAAGGVTRLWYELPVRSRRAGTPALRVRFGEDVGWSVLVFPLAALLLLALFWRVFNTARRRIERTQCLELAVARARAERELAERMAHDIRSPLSAFTMTVGRGTPIGPGERRLLDLAARRIVEISDDLLSKARPRPSDVNLADVVRRLVTEVLAADPGRSAVRVKLDLRDAVVRGDSCEISRALSNLLTNAFEAEPRTVRVSLRPTPRGARVVIADDGRGVPAAVLPRLGRERITSGKSGHGLGVWTAGELARRTGGALTFTSREGRGTTVKLTLGTGKDSVPRDRAPIDAGAPPPDAVEPTALT